MARNEIFDDDPAVQGLTGRPAPRMRADAELTVADVPQDLSVHILSVTGDPAGPQAPHAQSPAEGQPPTQEPVESQPPAETPVEGPARTPAPTQPPATMPQASASASPPPTPSVELQPAPRTTTDWSARIVWAYTLFGAIAALLAVLALALDWTVLGRQADRIAPAAFAGLVMGAGLAVLHWLDSSGRGKGYGIFRPLIGTDLRYSTSLTQMGAWTIVVGTGLAYLLGRVAFEGLPFDTVVPDDRWEQYLILLGGPFAATVLAKRITTYKVERGTLQKTQTDATQPAQVFKGDQGDTDLVDAQYLVFNVIAMGYFIVQLAATEILPGLPAPLLAITSTTAGAYVANKVAQGNAPMISSVTPIEAMPGDVVTVFGSNFDPLEPPPSAPEPDPGSPAQSDAQRRYAEAKLRWERRRVTVALSGHTETIYPLDAGDDRVRFVVPPAAAAGDQVLRITSTAGVETVPHALKVTSASPYLIAVANESATLVAGQSGTLLGNNLGKDGEVLQLTVGTIPTTATVGGGGTRLDFLVPPVAHPGDNGQVTLTVSYRSGQSATLSVPLTQPD